MKVLLLDAYNLMYRARYGFGKGEHSTIFSFFRSLRPLVEKFQPDQVYFVLEGYPKKRMALLPEYKGTRVYDDKDDFQRQKRYIIDVMKESFPVHVVRHPDYECDDVIGNLVVHTHKDDECIVVSTDTDFIQLYDQADNVKLYNPVRKKIVDSPEFDYVTWKALKGDGSDNIEGFKGIGDKRATALALDEVMLEGFLGKDDNQLFFDRNYTLIRFHDLESELASLEENPPVVDWDNVREKFSELGFYSMTNDRAWKKYVDTFQDL